MKYIKKLFVFLAIAAAIYCFAGAISDGFFVRKTVEDAFANRMLITWAYIAGIIFFLALAGFIASFGFAKNKKII